MLLSYSKRTACRKRNAASALAILLLALAVSSCQQNEEPAEKPLELPDRAEETAQETRDQHEVGDFSKIRTMTFSEFEEQVAKVEGLEEHYIVNGDVGIVGRRNLEAYFREVKNRANGVAGGKLLVNRVGDLDGDVFSGRPDIWDPQMRKRLHYCISSSSLGTAHGRVATAMAVAANDWERYADIDFVHRKELDDDCHHGHDDLAFTVEQAVLGGALAMAPFPEDQKVSRILRLDRKYLKEGDYLKYPLDGLLRHELGHVLGFDHEMLRPEAGFCFVANDTFAVTPFDPQSVMMYPECYQQGTPLGARLSELDKVGVACIYGPGPDGRVDEGTCSRQTAYSATGGVEASEKWSDTFLEKGRWLYLDPLAVRAGSMMLVELEQRSDGDADLYVRYAGRPSLVELDCAPRRELKSELCRLHVPQSTDGSSVKKVHIGALGIESSSISITVKYVLPSDEPVA